MKPAKLTSRLHAVHRREQALNMVIGLLTLCKWGVLLFLAGFAVDWLVRLPVPARFLVLLLLLAVPLYRAWRTGWRRLKSFSLARAALKVEAHYKNLESLLITGVQLGARAPSSGTSPALTGLIVKRADEAVSTLNAGQVVPFRELHKPAMMAGLLVAVICAFAAVNPPLFMTAVARLFSPWQLVAYPTRTHLELDGGELIVKEGDGLRIRARLSGVIPADAKLSIRTGEGEPNKRTLGVVDNACEYEMAAVFRSFEYAISAGDARSGWHTVTVIGSPQVARTQIRVVYPAYMNRAPETNDAMTLTVPEGARLEWNLQLDRPVSSATFGIEGAEPVPLQVGGEGLTVRHEMAAVASGAYSFSWVEKQYGFGFNSAKNYLQVAPDQPPQIELVSPGKNLFATIGRRMDLAFRAWDDHGIGEIKIAYRHNDAEEKLVPIPFEASPGRKVQASDWDYRKVVTGLAVGDTIRFAVEVGDLYPAADGRHHVRSDSRRVSFLSKDDYLAKIHEQKQRLLSSLRSAYRQERAAHDVIRNLDPTDDAFEQTCFLEASRQDIIMERITSLNGGVRDLIDDLSANHITDKSEFEDLEEMQGNLAAISKDHISAAVSQLRELGASAKSDAGQVARTTVTVNTTARELGSLVLQLGVSEAMEVFARELHVIAQSQNALRVRTIGAVGESAALSREQEELAGWIGRLLGELGGINDYSKSPLTIVRLARMIKDLRTAGIESSMRKVADLLGNGKGTEAANLQKAIIMEMFGLECNIRVGAEREALLDARNLFTSSINELNQTASANDRRSAEQLAQRLGGLHRNIRLLVIPAIPAPEPEFLAAKPTEIPPVEGLLVSVVDSLQQAIESIRAGEPDPSRVRQRQAVASLQQLNAIVDTRLAEITKTARYAGNSGASMERSSLIRELLSSQMRLTEKTEDAEYDKISGAYLAPSQLQLSKEVLRMRDRLEKMNSKPSVSTKMLAPLLTMLTAASDAMIKAAPALEANKLGEAIEQQDLVLDALQGAAAFSHQEASGWLGLANLIMTTDGVALPAKYMRDIVAEQQDLIEETRKSTPESRKQLLQIQKNLGQAVYDVSTLLAGSGSSLDFEQAMIFAGSDMGASALKLESGEVAAAVSAQSLAAESVADLSRQFHASEKQYGYFVTVLEFLQERHADGVVLLGKLNNLHERMNRGGNGAIQTHAEALRALHEESGAFSTLTVLATGRKDYAKVQASLANAIKELSAGESEACLDEVQSAGDSLQASMDELRELTDHIGYIPSVLPIEAPQEYQVMLEMVNLVVRQQALSVAVHRAAAGELPRLLPELRALEETAGGLINSTSNHAAVVAALQFMKEASGQLEQSSRVAAYDRLHQSETMLSQGILEYALYYIELKRPMGGKKKKKGKSGIVTDFKLTLNLKRAYDKDYGGVEGEDPKSGRSEWEVLGSRDRAALNENFVRELPLEYRGFLKDYYERLTK